MIADNPAKTLFTPLRSRRCSRGGWGKDAAELSHSEVPEFLRRKAPDGCLAQPILALLHLKHVLFDGILTQEADDRDRARLPYAVNPLHGLTCLRVCMYAYT